MPKPHVSTRERLAWGAAVATLLGGAIVYNAISKLVEHPDNERAHPAVQAHLAQHDTAIADVNTGLAKIADTLRELEKDRVAREKESELKRREYWRESQEQRDQKLIETIVRSLGEKPRR